MIAALIILAVFIGLSFAIATFACVVFLAAGKLTLPHTNARREMRARTETAIAEQSLLREKLIAETDDVVHRRLNMALNRGDE